MAQIDDDGRPTDDCRRHRSAGHGQHRSFMSGKQAGAAPGPHGIGRLAAERVFARLDGDRTIGKTYIVPNELIARGSGEIGPND